MGAAGHPGQAVAVLCEEAGLIAIHDRDYLVVGSGGRPRQVAQVVGKTVDSVPGADLGPCARLVSEGSEGGPDIVVKVFLGTGTSVGKPTPARQQSMSALSAFGEPCPRSASSA